MRSTVNWALLGLIIERPTYAYDLAQRFERRYGAVLSLSNIGHVYTALKALAGRSLIEEIPGMREGRQPRPHYRSTSAGIRAYREWLVAQVGEDRRRNELFVLALGALANEPEQVLEVMSGYEQAWLSEGMRTRIAREHDTASDGVSALFGPLIDEENRLAVGAKLEWVEYARQKLEKLSARSRQR